MHTHYTFDRIASAAAANVVALAANAVAAAIDEVLT